MRASILVLAASSVLGFGCSKSSGGGGADARAGLDGQVTADGAVDAAVGGDAAPADAASADAARVDAAPVDAAALDAAPDAIVTDDAAPVDAGGLDAGGADGGAGCVTMPMSPLLHDAFTGSHGCAGVQPNQVLYTSPEVSAHNAAYCTTLANCVFPAPVCPPDPPINLSGQMIVYVVGWASGCSAGASIIEVRDCGSQIEVDYEVRGVGPCMVILNAWQSVVVSQSALPVVFNQIP